MGALPGLVTNGPPPPPPPSFFLLSSFFFPLFSLYGTSPSLGLPYLHRNLFAPPPLIFIFICFLLCLRPPASPVIALLRLSFPPNCYRYFSSNSPTTPPYLPFLALIFISHSIFYSAYLCLPHFSDKVGTQRLTPISSVSPSSSSLPPLSVFVASSRSKFHSPCVPTSPSTPSNFSADNLFSSSLMLFFVFFFVGLVFLLPFPPQAFSQHQNPLCSFSVNCFL